MAMGVDNVPQLELGRSSFKTFLSEPAPALREYIDLYYGEEAVLNGFEGSVLPHDIHVLPTGYAEMHFGYHGTLFRLTQRNVISSVHCGVVGGCAVESAYRVRNVGNETKVIHVKFRPGGFYRLFGIYERDIGKNVLCPADVLGRQGAQLDDRLDNSSSNQERVEILNDFFSSHIGKSRTERSVVTTLAAYRTIVDSRGRKRIRDLLSELSIPERTLERKFSDHIGLSPKELSRVVRIRNVLDILLSGKFSDWGDVVESSGYYDQAHFDKEFKSATTVSPEAFLSGKGKSIIKFRSGLFLPQSLEAEPVSYQHVMEETAKSGQKSSLRGI